MPGTAPAGVQAKHEPAYEAITEEVAKLESPAAAGVRWDEVVRGAGELLKGTTKDLWLASYMAYGLYATRGVDGAATGAAIIVEVTERYWPDLYPELKRLRGRANAVGWFVERLGRMLPTVDQASVSAESLEALAVALKRLAQLSRERFADSAPAFGPVQDAVARLRAGLPEPVPAAQDVASASGASASDDATAHAASGDAASANGSSGSTAADEASGNATAANGASGNRAANGASGNTATANGTSGNAGANGAPGNTATANSASGNRAANGAPGAAAANGAPGNSAANGTAGNPAAKGASGNASANGAAKPNTAAPARNTVPAAPVVVPPLPTLPASPDLSSAEAVTDFLRTVGTALLSAAGVLRQTSGTDPLPYRLMRLGLWLHLSRAPAAGANGRTPLQPLPDALRTKLETLESNQRWPDLLDEAESALGQHRFALGLHRFSAAALTGLGESHAAARVSLVQELGAQLRRMPGVDELVAANGKPLTDDATRAWLRAEVLPTGTSSATPSAITDAPLSLPPLALQSETSTSGSSTALEEEARALLAEGRVHEAVTRLQGAVAAATTGRARFLSRLALARLCANAGQLPLARAVYDVLDEEVSAHALDTWEPALAAACLEGWLSTRTTEEKEGGRLAVKFRNRYRRLTRLDSSAALRVGA
ncbi:type VI secretion system protein TssA [Pyxidicoccus parkwayensis]|uniref:type VI secretion system protein TssA n=1 Tax=Pyxidicoccus parkwayensis TaxID=2813578 RepID=UPI001F50C4EB|nr:type VI secretion system protein TssA [Pyxidicoccus parkwaysis]